MPAIQGTGKIAAEFAAAMPVGTPCRYFPVLPCAPDRFERATIRSQPWVVGGDEVIVKITGRTGGVSINHIMPDGRDA